MPDANDRRLIKGATVVVEQDGAVRTTEGNRSVRWAYRTGDTTKIYLGKSTVGSSETDYVWCVTEIDLTNGSIKYADYGQYDQKWSDRESLSYA